jgi:hypothetical protein
LLEQRQENDIMSSHPHNREEKKRLEIGGPSRTLRPLQWGPDELFEQIDIVTWVFVFSNNNEAFIDD